MISKLKKSELPFKIPFQCRHCEKWDTINRSQLDHYEGAGRFCSRECTFTYWRLHPEKRSDWKGGRYIDKAGYVVIRDYRGSTVKQIREHRAIMELELGRGLETWEHVHHRNGDRTDNRIENLVVFLEHEHHSLHHGRPWWGKPPQWMAGASYSDTDIGATEWENPTRIELDPWQEFDVIDAYLDGNGMMKTGALFGLSKIVVKRILREHAISARKSGRPKGMKVTKS